MGKFRWTIAPQIFPIAGKLPINRRRAPARAVRVSAADATIVPMRTVMLMRPELQAKPTMKLVQKKA
jgi:hypothetical protein